MISCKVEYTAQAVKQLKKLDVCTRRLIYAWIDKNLQGCSNPRSKGKAPTANKSGQRHYRIGDYRLLTEIDNGKITILALTVGYRR